MEDWHCTKEPAKRDSSGRSLKRGVLSMSTVSLGLESLVETFVGMDEALANAWFNEFFGSDLLNEKYQYPGDVP
ncbi:hypothetical protein CDL15_Pgr002873 [Punica granatum]|uniref:Uncharacterized protein n=1 Tax=Punica granatum TaxID=22663 RepID=A0A218X2X5_PUNGR|nr:hypothetical protein CDL15_Pgr002873 [Punica granatum]